MIFATCFLLTGIIMNYNLIFFIFAIIPLGHMFIYQIKNLDISKPNICLKIFKSNNLFGAIILTNILVGKF